MIFQFQHIREELLLFMHKSRKTGAFVAVNPIKVKIGHGLKSTFGFLFKYIHPKKIQTILKPLTFFPLRGIINKIWNPVLRLNGYRNLLCEWSDYLRKKTNSPGHYLNYIDNLMFASRFKEASEMVEAISQIIYANPRLSEFSARINSRAVILDIELNGLKDWHSDSLNGDDIVATHFYHRMWMAHNMRMTGKTVQSAAAHLAASGYPQQTIAHIWGAVFEPNGLAEDMHLFVQKARAHVKIAETASKVPPQLTLAAVLKIFTLRDIMAMFPGVLSRLDIDTGQRGLDRLELVLLLDQAKFDEMAEMVEEHAADKSFAVPISQYYLALDQQEKAIEILENALHAMPTGGDKKDAITIAKHTERAATLGELGEHYEVLENYDAALLYFRRAVNSGKTGTYLVSVSYPWHYMLILIAFEHWDEVIHVMREGQKYMWSTLHVMSTTTEAERIACDFAIPDEGALFLGGWGLGDEILRLSILRNIMTEKGKYGVLCDPRVKEVAQRSLPKIEFLSNSRTVGPFKVDEEEYWRDREGVTAGLDFARTTVQVLERRKDFSDIAITEDLTFHYLKCKGTYKVKDKSPLFTPKPELVKNARDWMNTLPGKLNVAIAWRSGARNFVRDKSYSDIVDWGKILKLPNINFINIQYSDTSEEVAEVFDKHGVNIHAMPGVDLKDDVEEILAVSKAVDLVISPCTASLEMAGAVGAPTWSLSTTSPKSDYWRINKQDRETDVFFPSIKHITLEPYGSTEAVLEEVARRLDEWQNAELKGKKSK